MEIGYRFGLKSDLIHVNHPSVLTKGTINQLNDGVAIDLLNDTVHVCATIGIGICSENLGSKWTVVL